WLLYSICRAARVQPATLQQIIEAGDAFNHALFTADEVNGGLDRLMRAGYVTTSDDRRVAPLESAAVMCSNARGSGRNIMEVLAALEVAMSSNTTSARNSEPIVQLFSKQEIHDAMVSYRERAL